MKIRNNVMAALTLTVLTLASGAQGAELASNRITYWTPPAASRIASAPAPFAVSAARWAESRREAAPRVTTGASPDARTRGTLVQAGAAITASIVASPRLGDGFAGRSMVEFVSRTVAAAKNCDGLALPLGSVVAY